MRGLIRLVLVLIVLLNLGCGARSSGDASVKSSDQSGADTNHEAASALSTAAGPREASGASSVTGDRRPAATSTKPRPSADAAATLAWLETIRDIRLEYHARLKYGGSGRNIFDPDARQIKAKWTAVAQSLNNAPRDRIDQAVIRYFSIRAGFELLVQQKEKELADAMSYWMVRYTLERLGGEDVEKIYEALPDDLEVKQDFLKIFDQLTKSGADLRQAGEILGFEDHQLRAHLKTAYQGKADAMLAAIDVLHDPLHVGKFEKQWLEKNNPALLRKLEIEGRRAASAARAEFARMEVERYLPDIEHYGGGISVRKFQQHAAWVKSYDEAGIGFLAVPHIRAQLAAFLPAVRESMLAKADALDPQTQAGLIAHTLQSASLNSMPVKQGNASIARLVARLELPDILSRLSKILGPKIGFVGTIALYEAPVDMALSADGSRLVVIFKNTIDAYDLATGKPAGEAIVIPDTDPQLERVAMGPKGDVAYVADRARRLHRVDLKSSKLDTSFSPVQLTHSDPAIAISPTGSLIAVTGSNFVQLFDAGSGGLKGRINADNLVNTIRFTTDGRVLLVGGNDRKANGYDVANGQRIWKREFGAPHGQYVFDIVATNDDYLLVGGSDHFSIWKGKAETPFLDVPLIGGQYCRAVMISADRKFAVNEFALYDLTTRKEAVGFAHGQTGRLHRFTPDGKRLAFAIKQTLFVVPVITSPDQKW